MTKIDLHKKLCDELNGLYSRKNHDYGDSFHKTFLEEGFAMPRIRLSDKLNRFKNLTKGAGELIPRIKRPEVTAVYTESLRDTLLDLANYALMTILELDEMSDEDDDDESITL